MLTTELHQAHIPAIFEQFRTVVGERAWLDSAQDIARQIGQSPYMRDHYLNHYRVVMALQRCSEAAEHNNGVLPWEFTYGAEFLETFVFAFQVLQLINAAQRMSSKRSSILVARIREALRHPRMLQAMQLEAQVATHFVSAGRSVVFPELGSGSENFDLLIEDLGPVGLEIECKVVTHDKGRKIHRVEARHFLGRLQSSPLMQAFARNLRRGLAVRVTVPERMPSAESLGEFHAAILRQILASTSGVLADGTRVNLVDFDPAELQELEHPVSQFTKDAVERILGTKNPHFFIHRVEAHAGGVVVVAIDSSQPDSMLHETFATFADAASRQLTGNRAGALMASFEGLGTGALLDIARGEGRDGSYSALAWAASAFLERSHYPHVVGVGFLSEPDFSSTDASTGGVSYWIPRPTSTQWSTAFSGFFSKIQLPPLLV